MNLHKKILFSLLLLSVSFSSFAWWGLNGHRIVGEIADLYVNAKARKAIKQILGDESIAMCANWADFVKSDTSYNYLYSWHYVNLKAGLTYEQVRTQLAADTGANAYARLNFLIEQLKSKELGAATKKMYLRLLVHIAGDIHQPMHVGRPEDLGGNRIKVQWFSEPANLHSVWDDKLLEFQKLSYTEYATAINHTSKSLRKKWQAQPVSEWFFESYTIAQQLYDEIKQPDQKLSYRYNFDHLDTMNEQLLKGGVRLAGLLNEIFG